MYTHYRPLRLNVGFLLSQTAGYGRLFDFREDSLALGSDIRVEAFTGHLQLNRTPQGIVAKGDFSALLPAECARCLKAFSTPVAIHLEDLFVYPPQNATDPLLLVGEDAHLNLEPLLREYVLINQPTRPLCRPDCKGLCPVCGNDLNEKQCFHPEESEGRDLLPSALILPARKPSDPSTVKHQKPDQREIKTEKKPARTKAIPKRKTPTSKPRKQIPQTRGGKSPAGRKTAGGVSKKTTKK